MNYRERLSKIIRQFNDDSISWIESLADHLIANGVTFNQWISVDDKLPAMGERVIACIRGIAGEAYLSCFGVWIRNEHSFEEYMGGKVTHWMPIPAPPEEENHV